MRLSFALSLALASAGAAAPDRAPAAARDLQDSVTCLAGGGDFFSCCPSAYEGADPDDGVCTLLSCLDLSGGGVSLRDTCSCTDIVSGCDQVTAFGGVVTQLPGMCASVGACCADGNGTTTPNVDWDACMALAAEAGDHELPDFSALIPGGVPVFEESPVASATTTVVPELIDDGGMALPSSTIAAAPEGGSTTAVPAVEEFPSTAAASSSEFSPPPSVMCLAGSLSGAAADGSTFLECCPEATPDDGICTMIWCIDLADLSVKDGCECSQLETSCAQLASFAALVPNVPEACEAVAGCCADDGSTSGEDFNSCMGGKGLTPPDFGSLVPGGLPEELTGGGVGGAVVETDATAAPPAEVVTEATTAVTAVPAAEAPVPPAEATGRGSGRPAGGGFASAVVVVALTALAVSSVRV